MKTTSDFIAKRFRSIDAGLSLDTKALARYNDVIDLSIGDTDFITDDAIIDAAFHDAKAGYTHYGNPMGDPELIHAVCAAWQEDFRQPLTPDHVLITASSCLGMALVMMAILDPGDEVIVFSPYFSLYRNQIELAGGVCVEVPTYAEESWAVDEARLRAAITPKTKAIIFNNPCNPTGMMYSRKELEAIAKVCVDNDLYVLSDEIYSELSYQGDHVSIAAIPGMKERSVVINGFSKSYAMTGWRLGYAVGPKEIIKQMIKVHQYLIMSAPTTSQYAAIEALRNGDEDVAKMRESYDERRRFLVKELREMGMPCFEPMGAFYVFPNISRFGMTSEEFAKTLLEKEHVAVVPGSAFGTCGEGFLRISYAYSIEDLKKALVKIQNFIDTIS